MILVPQPTIGVIESQLIFNIKDTYHERYIAATPGTTQPYSNTGILKEVELNGHPIWSEDVAKGGDGWERVAIPLTNNPAVFSFLNIGTKNTITFSIVNTGTLPNNANVVTGLAVFVDDVYINKYNSLTGEVR